MIQVVPIGVPPAEGKTATDIAFTPNGRYALVPNYAKNVLDCIDTRTYAVTDIPTGPTTQASSRDANGNWAPRLRRQLRE